MVWWVLVQVTGLIRQAVADRSSHRLPIIVDQVEQLFAAHTDPGDREVLFRALLAATASADPAALVILSVRSDF